MTKLLFIELRAQARSLLILVPAVLFLGIVTRSPSVALVIPTVFAFILNWTSKRSHWYLELPYSRKKILFLLIVQTLILFAALSFIGFVVWAGLISAFPSKKPLNELLFAIPLVLVTATLALTLPLSGVPRPRHHHTEIKFDKAFFKGCASAAAVIALFLLASWASESLTTTGMFASFPLAIIFGVCHQSMVAPNTLKKVRAFCLIAFGIIVATLLACYLLA